jgi:hypothetical protein
MSLFLVPRPSYNAEYYLPVKALWAKVVVKAICDFVMFQDADTLRGKREFLRVKEWLFGKDTGFTGVCETIGWLPEMVRERALSMTKDEVRKIEHRDRDPVLLLREVSSRGIRR